MKLHATDMVEALAAEIRGEMAAQDKSRSELDKDLGLSRPSVSARLSGRIPFDIKEIAAVAGTLGMDASELVSRAEQRALGSELVAA